MIPTMSHWSSGLTCLLPTTRVTGSNPLGGTNVKPGFSWQRCLATILYYWRITYVLHTYIVCVYTVLYMDSTYQLPRDKFKTFKEKLTTWSEKMRQRKMSSSIICLFSCPDWQSLISSCSLVYSVNKHGCTVCSQYFHSGIAFFF